MDPASTSEPASPTSRTRLPLLVGAAAVGLLLISLGWAAPVLGPLGLGLFLTALAAPFFGWLESRGLASSVALVVTLAVVLLIGGLLVLLAFASARSLSDSLAGYTSALDGQAADLTAKLDSMGIPAPISGLIPPDVLSSALQATIGIVTQVATSAAFAIVLAALLLLDGRRLVRLQSTGGAHWSSLVQEVPALARAAVTYFTVRIRINALTALGLLVLMLVLGVDDPVLWAVGAFFLSFVPYLGLTLALIPPTILAFAESGAGPALTMVVGGIALNVLAENVLEPTLTGRALSLATWLVFASFFFWVWLLGPVGALLSMPITVFIVLVLRDREPTRWLADLLAHD
jgi:AI-2 transport protein TqsA